MNRSGQITTSRFPHTTVPSTRTGMPGLKRTFDQKGVTDQRAKRANLDAPTGAGNGVFTGRTTSVNVTMMDSTNMDQALLFSHAIFSVQNKHDLPFAYTLDQLNTFLLAERIKGAYNDENSIASVIKQYGINLCGFFSDFSSRAPGHDRSRTMALFVGGPHDVTVPLSSRISKGAYAWLYFEAKRESAKDIQKALSNGSLPGGASVDATGNTVYLEAKLSSTIPRGNPVFVAGHLNGMRTPFTNETSDKYTPSCTRPGSNYHHTVRLQIILRRPLDTLYID